MVSFLLIFKNKKEERFYTSCSGGAIKEGREERLKQEERQRTGIISTMGQIRVQSETVSPSNRRADRREISRVVYQEEGDREEGWGEKEK